VIITQDGKAYAACDTCLTVSPDGAPFHLPLAVAAVEMMAASGGWLVGFLQDGRRRSYCAVCVAAGLSPACTRPVAEPSAPIAEGRWFQATAPEFYLSTNQNRTGHKFCVISHRCDRHVTRYSLGDGDRSQPPAFPKAAATMAAAGGSRLFDVPAADLLDASRFVPCPPPPTVTTTATVTVVAPAGLDHGVLQDVLDLGWEVLKGRLADESWRAQYPELFVAGVGPAEVAFTASPPV